MPTYTVENAIKTKDVPGQHGPMQVIMLQLREQGDPSGLGTQTAEWFTKATTPMPAQGSSIEGTIEPSNYGPKFKKAQAGGFGGGGPSKGRSPEENARIVRQHSQEMALRYATLKAQIGQSFPADMKPNDLKAIVDWFDADVFAVKAPAPAASSTPPPSSSGGYE